MSTSDKTRNDSMNKKEGDVNNDVSSFGKVTFSFLEKTTAHGLSRVATEKTIIRKIIWAVIFLIALNYFIFQFTDQYRKYRSYPVAVKTSIVRRNVFTFPAITVCNSNILKRSKLNGTRFASLIRADTNALSELEGAVNAMVNTSGSTIMTSEGRHEESKKGEVLIGEGRDSKQSDDVSKQESEPDCSLENKKLCGWSTDRIDEAVKLSQTSDLSDLVGLVRPTWQELEEFGYNAEEFIGQCSFDNKPCWPSNFSLIRDSEHGNCFVFNSAIHGQHEIRQTSKVGLRYGLRLTLVVSQDDFVGLLAHESGVRITVHSPWVHPFPNDQAVSAGTGLKTTVGTRMNKQTRLRAPYPSECAEIESNKLDYPGNYTVLACKATCIRQHIKDCCGCLPKAISPNDRILCTTTVKESCMAGILQAIDQGKLKCSCPAACVEETYLLSVSSTPWPTDAYSPYIEKLTIDEGWIAPSKFKWELNKNLVRFHIYIEDIDIITLDEYPAYPWQSLLADTGGFLGLFIGVSLCTLLEVVEFIFDLAMYLMKKRKNKDDI